MVRFERERFDRGLLLLAKAVAVGMAYVSAVPIPGLTSSFVAIFGSLLPFDIMVASTRPPVAAGGLEALFPRPLARVVSTAVTLLKGVAVGGGFGILGAVGLPFSVGAVLTSGLAYVWASRTRHNISTYVALIGGLSLFERLSNLEAVETGPSSTKSRRPFWCRAAVRCWGWPWGGASASSSGSVTRLFVPAVPRCRAPPTSRRWSTAASATSCT